MKIEKLILKNFAAVDNAMNTNELTIDFSKSENKICLLIGPNGSGKTTILSLLNLDDFLSFSSSFPSLILFISSFNLFFTVMISSNKTITNTTHK